MREMILRFLLIIPWMFLAWLIGQGIQGEINGFLVFILCILLVPALAMINLITTVVVRGGLVIKQMKDMQAHAEQAQSGAAAPKRVGRKKAQNVAELKWYDMRRWRQ